MVQGTDWERAKACIAASQIAKPTEVCLDAARVALEAGYAVEAVNCPKCKAAQLSCTAPVNG